MSRQRSFDCFQQAKFSIQPRGDSWSRKAVVDSILLGCIPVVLNSLTWEYPLYPNPTVLLPIDKGGKFVLNGSAVDSLFAVLRAYTPAEIETLQARLRLAAPLLQYTHPSAVSHLVPQNSPDAFEVLLQALARNAEGIAPLPLARRIADFSIDG